jgi:WD40 repeat protein
LETIVLKAINKEPGGRYQTAAELADDLSEFLAGRPVRARRTSIWERTAKWVKRQPTIAALMAAILLALVAGIGATAWQAIRATRAELDALGQKMAAVEAKGMAINQAERNRRLLYTADINLASQVWQSDEGTVSQCNELLLSHVPGPGQADLREFCWRYQWRLLHPNSVVRLPVVPRAAGVDARDRLVTLDVTGKVQAWPIGDDNKREELSLAQGSLLGVTLSRNGEVAAIIERDGSPKVFDVRTGVQKVQIRTPSPSVRLKLSVDGRYLASVGRDNHARIWETVNGKELYDYPMIDPTAKEIDLSLDGKLLLAAATTEGTLVVLYRAGEEKPLILNPQSNGFNRVQGSLSPDGKLAAVAVAGNSVEFYDTTTGKLGRWLRSRSPVERITFSTDGHRLAVGERTGLVTLWSLPQRLMLPGESSASQELLQNEPGRPLARNLKGHEAAIEAIEFTANGGKLISIGQDKTARSWELGNLEESQVLQDGPSIDGLSYSPDGRYLLVTSMHYGVHMHDLASKAPPRSLTTRPSRRGVFSPDGRTIAGGPDHCVSLWDAKTGGQLATLADADPAEQDPVNGCSNLGALVFSPNGRWLAAGYGALYHFSSEDAPQKVMVFDVAQRKVHRTFATPSQVSALAFSADDKLMAAAGHNGTIWLWDTTNWEEVGQWQGPPRTGYGSILFLSGAQADEAGGAGGLLATGSKSGRIDLWDVRTKALARQLHGHTTLVSFMALSPDGRTLATASCDGSIKLWDGGTCRELRTLYRQDGWMYALSFSPDGNTLASGGLNPLVRFWEASSKESVADELTELDLLEKQANPKRR